MAVSRRSGPVGAGVAYARSVCDDSVLEIMSLTSLQYALQVHFQFNSIQGLQIVGPFGTGGHRE